ncbi:MAG: hypothetical protein ACLPVO_07610 [Desulfomonilaceae bacterium]
MSSPKEEASIVLKICLGAGSRFNGIACEYFARASSECDLLKNGTIKSVYENGRCLSIEEIHTRTDLLLKKYDQQGEFIDLKSMLYGGNPSDSGRGGLLNAKLDDPTITTLYSFVNRSIYNKVAQTLRPRGLFSDRKMCGTCAHHGSSSPRSCRLEMIQNPKTGEFIDNGFFGQERKASDPVCAGYLRKDTRTEPLEEIETRAFQSSQSDSPLQNAIETQTQTIENVLIAKIDFGLLEEWLIKRVVEAGSSKQREIAQRHFDLITRLCQLFQENEDDPVRLYLDEMSSDQKNREALRKRTERDLFEIGKFFREEMSKK